MAEGYEPRPLSMYDNQDFRSSAHENITAERAFYCRIGRVVVVDLSFTVNATISGATTVIFSGLPKCSFTNLRFRIPAATAYTIIPLRLSINNLGQISNAYSAGDVIPAGTFEGQFVYICE